STDGCSTAAPIFPQACLNCHPRSYLSSSASLFLLVAFCRVSLLLFYLYMKVHPRSLAFLTTFRCSFARTVTCCSRRRTSWGRWQSRCALSASLLSMSRSLFCLSLCLSQKRVRP